MKKLSAKALWIISAVLFLIGAGIIVGITFSSGSLTTVLLVILVIDIIVVTGLVQMASFKSFKPKLKKPNYETTNYKCDADLFSILEKNGFKERKTNFGSSFLKIVGSEAYKVVLVTDNEKYFNPEEDKNYTPDKRLDKCNTFIAFEIFLDLTEDLIEKLPDYSIQGEKVYYTAFGKEDNKYTCFNYLEPLDKFKNGYNYLLDLLRFIKNEEE